MIRTPKLNTAAAAAFVILSGIAWAQTPKAEEDHSTHHPAGNAAAAAAPAPQAAAGPTPEAVDRQMKAMQEMHQKMQAAKSPSERARLMDEHMKLMQSGTAMMGQMQSGPAGMAGMSGMGGSAAGGSGNMMGMHMHMERRMAMMEQMMQMMVDREAAKAGK